MDRNIKKLMEYISNSCEKENYFLFINSYIIFKNDLKPLYITSSSLFITYFITYLLKGITNRERPTGNSSRWNSSFPSGHASSAFAFANSFSKIEKKYKIPLFIWALSVSFSRIYLRKHWFTDTVAGAGIGLIISEIIYKNFWEKK
ncbi:MAG: phosphatase PAP2 family protein [candidate division WOR-3 bacterium]